MTLRPIWLSWMPSRRPARQAKAGVQGYCMGGALSFRTAAAVPGRIAAVGSFHGGNGLVTQGSQQPASLDHQDQCQLTWYARRRMTMRKIRR